MQITYQPNHLYVIIMKLALVFVQHISFPWAQHQVLPTDSGYTMAYHPLAATSSSHSLVLWEYFCTGIMVFTKAFCLFLSEMTGSLLWYREEINKELFRVSATIQNNTSNQSSFTAVKPTCGSRQILSLFREGEAFLILEWKNSVQRLVQELNTVWFFYLAPQEMCYIPSTTHNDYGESLIHLVLEDLSMSCP